MLSRSIIVTMARRMTTAGYEINRNADVRH